MRLDLLLAGACDERLFDIGEGMAGREKWCYLLQ